MLIGPKQAGVCVLVFWNHRTVRHFLHFCILLHPHFASLVFQRLQVNAFRGQRRRNVVDLPIGV